MELNVKGSGATKSFKLSSVEATITVAELKKKCEEECGFSPDQQRLFLKGKLLKDEDTLDAAKVVANSTLFLVKGASGSGGSGGAAGSDAKAEEKKKEEDDVPMVSVPCAGGCGFFGTAKTENYCSMCYAKKNADDGAGEKKKKQEAEKAKEEEEKKANAAEAGGEGEGEKASGSEEAEPERAEQKDKTKCWTCSKKCGLTGFDCRCGYVFCSKHRHAEDHDCDFDHKGRGREILAKNNPNITAKGHELHGL